MQLRNASLLSLEVSCVATSSRRLNWRHLQNTRTTAMMLLGGALLVLTSARTGLAHADPASGSGPSSKDTSFARTLWAPPGQPPVISSQADPPGDDEQAPPSDGIDWIYNEAQWDLPAASFILPAAGLYTAGSFESTQNLFIDKQAVIHTQAGTSLHLSGSITNAETSVNGLAKYGEGTLTLSGFNTYLGNTLLKEGTLRVEGEQALGETNRALDMHRGTQLHYAPGATLYNAVQLRDETGLPTVTPLDGSTPAAEDSVQFRVDSGVATQNGGVGGNVPIVKQGQGSYILRGAVFADPYAIVNEGTLSIRDTFFGGPVQVNSGARLEGNTTAGAGRVMHGAVLAPGTQGGIGMLAFEDLEMMPGATLELDVTADGKSDRVEVFNKVSLDGQVMAQAQAGDWKPSTSYTVLTASGGLDGTRFASVATNLAFLTPELTYDDNNVFLTLTRNEDPLDIVTETPTEEEVADVIEIEEPTEPVKPLPPVVVEDPVVPPGPVPDEPVVEVDPDPEVAVIEPEPEPTLYEEIIVMDKPQAREAFNQLSGSWAASVQSQLMEDSRFIREAALYNMPQAGLPTGPPAAHRVWHHAFHSAADRGARDGTPADARDINGLVMGLGRPLGRDWHASLYTGFQQSRMRRHQAMADAKADGVHAGVALARSWSAADFTVGAAHTWHVIDSHRNIAVAAMRHALSSRTRARTLQIFSQIAAPLRWLTQRDAKTRVEPFARLAWVHNRVDGYEEAGGAAALRVLPSKRSVLFSTLGVRAAHTIETSLGPAQLQGDLAWQHASGDVRSFSQQTFRDSVQQNEFRSEGQAVGRQALALRLGVEARVAKTVNVGVAYAGQFGMGSSGRSRQDHGARLNLSWAF